MNVPMAFWLHWFSDVDKTVLGSLSKNKRNVIIRSKKEREENVTSFYSALLLKC
jgi:hypothetical protein